MLLIDCTITRGMRGDCSRAGELGTFGWGVSDGSGVVLDESDVVHWVHVDHLQQ
jgi:hypothetical protein